MCRRAPATSSLVIYHLRLSPNAQMITSDEEDPSPTDETALFQLDRAPGRAPSTCARRCACARCFS